MNTRKTKVKRHPMGLEAMDDVVWCDVHRCVHARTHDPYHYGIPKDEAECGPSDWHMLWIGGYIEDEE